jgi:hypothetical protein
MDFRQELGQIVGMAGRNVAPLGLKQKSGDGFSQDYTHAAPAELKTCYMDRL